MSEKSGSAEELRIERERTLSLLYEMEMKSIGATELLADLPVDPPKAVVAVIEGVDASRERLDDLIRAKSKGWDLERLATIDRCVMRFGAWELTERQDLSVAVIINEAVDLAKRFSTDDSGKFVNGVLDAIAKDVRK